MRMKICNEMCYMGSRIRIGTMKRGGVGARGMCVSCIARTEHDVCIICIGRQSVCKRIDSWESKALERMKWWARENENLQ